VIADLSVNFVERIILQQRHTVQRIVNDYGYDLVLWTFDDRGYVEPRSVLLQIKATEALPTLGAGLVLDLDTRDYNL
jgi:hypothetical protein